MTNSCKNDEIQSLSALRIEQFLLILVHIKLVDTLDM